MWRKGESKLSHEKGMSIINPMIFHFTLEIVVKQNGISMFKASADIELRFFLKEMSGLLQ